MTSINYIILTINILDILFIIFLLYKAQYIASLLIIENTKIIVVQSIFILSFIVIRKISLIVSNDTLSNILTELDNLLVIYFVIIFYFFGFFIFKEISKKLQLPNYYPHSTKTSYLISYYGFFCFLLMMRLYSSFEILGVI